MKAIAVGSKNNQRTPYLTPSVLKLKIRDIAQNNQLPKVNNQTKGRHASQH